MDPERRSEATESKGRAKTGAGETLWFVYIIECRSGKLYTGMTGNLLRRWAEHRTGGSRFTKGDPAAFVLHVEAFPSKPAAAARERQLKGWTRAKKQAFAAGDLQRLKEL